MLTPTAVFYRFLPDSFPATVRRHLADFCRVFSELRGGAVHHYCRGLPGTEEGHLVEVDEAEVVRRCQLEVAQSRSLKVESVVTSADHKERWRADFRLGKIPNVSFGLSSLPRNPAGAPETWLAGLFQVLFAHGIADVGFALPECALWGSAWAGYLFEKITVIPSLHAWLQETSAVGSVSVVSEFLRAVKPVLATAYEPSGYVKIPKQRKAVNRFVQGCDELLLAAWGRDLFADRLRDLQVPIEAWLKSHRRKPFFRW